MTKLGAFLALFLLSPALAWAQGGGPFIRSNCSTLTSPVTHATVCFETGSGAWKVWNGTTFNAAGSGESVSMPNGTTYRINNYLNPAIHASAVDQYGLGILITGGTTGGISRIGLGIQAQSGGGASAADQVEAANFIVQQNAADTPVTMVGIELNVNNNNTDDASGLTGALHIGYSAVSDGSKIAAYAYGVSGAATWRRGLRIDQGAIASGGYAIDYVGDGSNGVFRVGADSHVEVGTPVIAYSTPGVHISGQTPALSLQETDQAANGKIWDVVSNGGSLIFRALTDDVGTANAYLTVTRSGASIGNVTLGGTVRINGLTSTGAASGKSVVCVDTATGQLYASSTGVDCSN